MEESKPLVSIIIRTKDRPRLLLHAIKSVASQTYRPIEVVLVNDGGCDVDTEELRNILGDIRLHYITLPENMGRTHAANRGISQSTGEHIGFLDDDDEYYPDHISELGSALGHGTAAAYSDSEIVRRKYDPVTWEYTESGHTLFFSRDFSFYELLVENYIPLINVLIKREALLSSGMFDESLSAYEDWDLFIRIGSQHAFRHIPRVTAKYIHWSSKDQIAHSPEHWAMLEDAYIQVVRKHSALFTPEALRHIRNSMSDMRKRIRDMEIQLTDNISPADIAGQEAGEKEKRLQELENYISKIHSGRGWKMLTRYYHIRDGFAAVLQRLRIKTV